MVRFNEGQILRNSASHTAKVSCSNLTTSRCCAARQFYANFKTLRTSSAAMGLTSREPGMHCYPKNFMQMLITSSSTHFRTRELLYADHSWVMKKAVRTIMTKRQTQDHALISRA